MARLVTTTLAEPVGIHELTRRQASELQMLMYGHYPGRPDGILGPLTLSAYTQLKQLYDGPADLTLDNDLLRDMRHDFNTRFRPRMEAPLNIMQLQWTTAGAWLQLCMMDRYPRPIDAMIGPRTQQAWADWLTDHGREASQMITAADAEELGYEFVSVP